MILDVHPWCDSTKFCGINRGVPIELGSDNVSLSFSHERIPQRAVRTFLENQLDTSLFEDTYTSIPNRNCLGQFPEVRGIRPWMYIENLL